MSLISCPKCGKRISDKAAECPACGYCPDAIPYEKEPLKQVASDDHAVKRGARRHLSPVFLAVAALAIAGVSFTGGFMLSGFIEADPLHENPDGTTVVVDDGEPSAPADAAAGSASVIKPEGEWKDSFSWQTGDETYPFSVSNEDFPPEGIGALTPLEKHSSSYPFQINLADAETTDSLPGIGFCMAGDHGGYSYDYELKQVETTEITVLDRSGEKRKAMVNTKLALTGLIGERDDKERLICQNCYLLKDENGEVYLAIPDMEGADNYVLYC